VVNTWPYNAGSTTRCRTANWAASVGPSTAEITVIRASSTGSEPASGQVSISTPNRA
jgi:hypothetical protein